MNQTRCFTVRIGHNLAQTVRSNLIVSFQKFLVNHRQIPFPLAEQIVNVIDVYVFVIDHAI